jgi:MOSC domain-containing protein YiiM
MIGSIVDLHISRGGLPKHPIGEGFLSPLGIEGDLHAHPHIHGGPRQAVLLICAEVIEELASQGYPVYRGALGENLTIRGIDHRQLRSGQRFRAGQAVIELTKIRAPCSTLDVYGPAIKSEIYDAEVKAGNPASPKWARGGFYAAVVQTGLIRRDDIIALVDQVV